MKNSTLQRVCGLFGSRLGRNPKTYSELNVGDFYTYIGDIWNVLNHVRKYESFTGAEAKSSLDSLCKSLEHLPEKVYAHQDCSSRPKDLGISVGKDTIELHRVYIPPPTSVYLGNLESATIRGRHSKSPCPQNLEAPVFVAYLRDIAKAMSYLMETPQYSEEARGEAMLGPQALKTIREIKEKLDEVSAPFEAWQKAKADTLLVQIPLKGKDFATFRLIV